METHGAIQINDFVASCSMYLPNWMNGRRKSFIWNFKTKEMHFQILSRVFNSETDSESHANAESLRNEWVIQVKGGFFCLHPTR